MKHKFDSTDRADQILEVLAEGYPTAYTQIKEMYPELVKPQAAAATTGKVDSFTIAEKRRQMQNMFIGGKS